MFIQTESTPNPATLKFIPGVEVLAKGTANFTQADQTARSPLAAVLFGIEGVTGVFLADEFITVTKHDDSDWYDLKASVLATIMDHFTARRPVMLEEDGSYTINDDVEDVDDADKEIALQIKELLETRVRPAVAQDGGDIIFRGFRDGVVMLAMQGSCSGCPSSTATLKMGIENMLKHYLPEVRQVMAV